jgi:hypothetical protein
MEPSHGPQEFVHGSKLRRKATEDGADDLTPALAAYEIWRAKSLAIHGREKDDVRELTTLLNAYKDTAEPMFDKRANSAQEVLQPSIIEEFFEYLFSPIATTIGTAGVRKPASGFLDLVFHPRSITTLIKRPEHTIRTKDHDFIIGSHLTMKLSQGTDEPTIESIIVPAVALECKRYLERNMLDECSGTAAKVKAATPYCLYVVVAEYLKMDDSRPELSKIDEIYILRRQRNSERNASDFKANPIAPDLVWDLYLMIINHLGRIWWDPENGVKAGKMFNFK